uniref:AT-hook motif nuclear-localized protein n=1 Tax=Solanum chacoense TaxID=4108 RepID=A0A0V0HT12_SOLCH
MEDKEGVNSSGVIVKSNEFSENYRMTPSNENVNGFNGAMAAVIPATSMSVAAPSTEGKKKRGRPKKYRPDGSLNTALSPMPISASIPLAGDFSAWKNSGSRPVDSFKKKNKFEVETPGEEMAYSVGANFTPHVITVNTGEVSLMY